MKSNFPSSIYNRDLYYLVKFLPAYALPPGLPSQNDLHQHDFNGHEHTGFSPTSGSFSIISKDEVPDTAADEANSSKKGPSAQLTSLGNRSNFLYQRTLATSAPELPLPATAGGPQRTQFLSPLPIPSRAAQAALNGASLTAPIQRVRSPGEKSVLSRQQEDSMLQPAYMPPKYHLFDVFPFSLLVRRLTKEGKEVKGRKAARLRAKIRAAAVSHNLPLEISLYLVSLSCFGPTNRCRLISGTNLVTELLYRCVAASKSLRCAHD